MGPPWGVCCQAEQQELIDIFGMVRLNSSMHSPSKFMCCLANISTNSHGCAPAVIVPVHLLATLLDHTSVAVYRAVAQQTVQLQQ